MFAIGFLLELGLPSPTNQPETAVKTNVSEFEIGTANDISGRSTLRINKFVVSTCLHGM